MLGILSVNTVELDLWSYHVSKLTDSVSYLFQSQERQRNLEMELAELKNKVNSVCEQCFNHL